MPVYSIAPQPVGVQGNTVPVLEIVPSPLSVISVRELHLSGANNFNNQAFQFGVPSAIGASFVNSVFFLPEDPADSPSLTQAVTAWGIWPVAPTNFLRRILFANVSSNGYDYYSLIFPRGLKNALGATFGLWCGTGNPIAAGLLLAAAVINE